MRIILANAKIMQEHSVVEPHSVPLFHDTAQAIATEMAQLDSSEMAQLMHCNLQLAGENCLRYRNFNFASKLPAIMAYNGQAYKHLRAHTLSSATLTYAQSHLWITCFLYGLLRPLDGIVPYRMEHDLKLQATGEVPLSRYWRDKLTDVLIESVKADDGILLHLSTAEFEKLFNWPRVCREVQVVQPLFYVNKGGELKNQAVWAKTCRGAMARSVLQNQCATIGELETFTYEGFALASAQEGGNTLIFVKNI